MYASTKIPNLDLTSTWQSPQHFGTISLRASVCLTERSWRIALAASVVNTERTREHQAESQRTRSNRNSTALEVASGERDEVAIGKDVLSLRVAAPSKTTSNSPR
jgi:hypothetical protein